MPLLSIPRRFRKLARRGSSIVAIKPGRVQPPTVSSLQRKPSTETTWRTASYSVGTVIPEVTPEPPQVDGYRSLLPEDAIPNLQASLASCGQLMISFSTGDELLEGRNVIELEHNIFQVLQHIRILRNVALPIGRLPPEVLTTIFDFVTTPSGTVDSTSAFKNLMAFLHVCRYWRAILLGHCKAWSNIHLKGHNPDLFAWQMAHARDAPLNVTVHLQDRIFDSGTLLLRNFYASVKTIRQHRHRVRSLSVHVTRFHSFQNFFNFELPNLEELAWEDIGLGNLARPSGPVWDWDRCPKLRCLSIKGTLDWPVKATTGLTEFKLEGPMAITIKDISGFLQSNKALESLELVHLIIPVPTPGETKTIKLPNLSTLSFRDVAHGYVFPFLSLPALKNLSIGSIEDPSQWSPAVWHNLFIPVGITSLDVKYLGWVGGFDRVRITGFDDTRTRSLTFTERSLGTRLNSMISALARTPLYSVTSVTFHERGTNNPRYQLTCEPLRAVLKSLPNIRHMDLCWGHLTHQIIEHLGHECPVLEVLRVKTTRLDCLATFGLVLRMVKSRADFGRRLSKVECVVAEEARGTEETRELWDTLARDSGFEGYLSYGVGQEPTVT